MPNGQVVLVKTEGLSGGSPMRTALAVAVVAEVVAAAGA